MGWTRFKRWFFWLFSSLIGESPKSVNFFLWKVFVLTIVQSDWREPQICQFLSSKVIISTIFQERLQNAIWCASKPCKKQKKPKKPNREVQKPCKKTKITKKTKPTADYAPSGLTRVGYTEFACRLSFFCFFVFFSGFLNFPVCFFSFFSFFYRVWEYTMASKSDSIRSCQGWVHGICLETMFFLFFLFFFRVFEVPRLVF